MLFHAYYKGLPLYYNLPILRTSALLSGQTLPYSARGPPRRHWWTFHTQHSCLRKVSGKANLGKSKPQERPNFLHDGPREARGPRLALPPDTIPALGALVVGAVPHFGVKSRAQRHRLSVSCGTPPACGIIELD